MKSVTIAINAKNVRKLIEENLPVIRCNVPDAEILLIDGLSNDGTAEAARGIADKVISDDGKGLAYARQLGIINASRPFVAIVGPDNVVTSDLLEAMQRELEADPHLAAVAPQTEVVDAHSYWERTTKYIFKYLINRPGYVDVVGTPCMFRRETMLLIPYDPNIRAAGDDTDVALRLTSAGYKLKIIDAFSKEKNALDRAAFIARWRWYGKGDAEFYAKHRDSWTIGRRIRSLLHPLRKYGIRAPWLFLIHGVPQYIPALFVATFARYSGWMNRAIELRRK